MAFIWDAKNNFILLHFVNLHQQQSLTSDIDWSSIANDIHLEISSTSILLQNQYEHLLKIFYPNKDSKSLHSILKRIYLNSLCQQIEEDSKLILETVYELVRHTRAKRINANDIEQLMKEWNFNYSSDEQKKNKEHLFNILNRLHDYNNSFNNHLPEYSNENKSSSAIPKESDNKYPTTNQQDNVNNHQLISNINEQEKSPMIRRRTQSLTVVGENKDNKVNIGVEWFVPKFKRQQRSSSLHARSQSPIQIDSLSSQNQNIAPDEIPVRTTIDNDESSNSTDNSNLRQTQTQPAISWLPLTDQQIVEKERRQTKSKSINDQDLEPVSSSDSDSIEIQEQISSNKKTSRDLHQQEHSSCKRQRISEDN